MSKITVRCAEEGCEFKSVRLEQHTKMAMEKHKKESGHGKFTQAEFRPRPKPKSRADRLSDALGEFARIADAACMLATDLEDWIADEKRSEEFEIKDAGSFDTPEAYVVEELRDEMSEWADNLDGANMSHLPKYEEVEAARDALETIVDEIEGIEEPSIPPKISSVDEASALKEDLEAYRDALQNVADMEGDVSFPGMY